MGIEESIKQIIANELAEVKEELTRLRTAVEDKNAMRFIMHTADVLIELGITQKTLIVYRKKGLLKCHQLKPGGKQFYKRDEVFAFLESDAPQAARCRKKRAKKLPRK